MGSRTINLPCFLRDHEYINVAKMKTHCQTTVSLCMKNQKGLLSENDKKDFHRKYNLNTSIVELNEMIRPDLNIIDGIIALEGNGPVNRGKRKKTKVLIGSLDARAADNVAAKIMGFDVSEIEHIPEVQYTVVGDALADWINPFLRPNRPYVDFNRVYSHFDETMCTMCGTPTEHALRSSFGYVVKAVFAGLLAGRKDVIYGKYDTIPEGAGDIICIGSCAVPFAQKHKLPVIKGCPPKVADLREQWLAFLRETKRRRKSL
jgi:hypothetical protein